MKYKCSCDGKYIKERYVNRNVNDSGYITVYDRQEKKEFQIEQISRDSFSNDGYDEIYFCSKCGYYGFYSEFENIDSVSESESNIPIHKISSNYEYDNLSDEELFKLIF